MMEKAKVQRLTLTGRTLVISDIHGNLPFLKGLLAQCKFSPEDTLILLGDMVEKSTESLATLRYIMALSKTHRVYPLMGNCDYITPKFADSDGTSDKDFVHFFRHWKEKTLLLQMAAELGFDRVKEADYPALRRGLHAQFGEELTFLRNLPTAIETDHFIFVHSGVPREDHLEELDANICRRSDNFLSMGYSFQKWCVVGHWPVTLYHPNVPNAAPYIVENRHIISIDGGCVLKLDGQLNALVIPHPTADTFSWESYDGLPLAHVCTPQQGSAQSVNVRWSDSRVTVLDRLDEFSLCRHESTGRELYILTDYLYEKDGETHCEDSTDYDLAVDCGDVISIVRETSRGYLAKKQGSTGWYRGQVTYCDSVTSV